MGIELKSIKSPADIKGHSLEELSALAGDIRVALLEKLSRRGGHVGPNLGFVEATIALHYVFNSPVDKIIFDVSHQCYTHKILTGRVAAFIDPEHYNDASGYTNPDESAHDFFKVGHTSTSISLASGLAHARDLQGGHENIIAVIGDGSLSGGEALEGLDNAGELGSNFIVVVNDNDMSIAENHGGIYDNLRALRESGGTYPDNYFRTLGFDYLYVGAGNDIGALIKAFESVKDIGHPVVVHINTEKGHGYSAAVANKEKWHWESPFDVATATVFADEVKAPSYADITARLLLDQMVADPRIVAVNAATPGLMGFTPERRMQAGRRFIDVGIAEEQAAGMSSGLAKGGMRPFWGVCSTFVQRAYDQISQDIAINNTPVVIGVINAGFRGLTDVTHLCWFDIPLLSNIPNIVMLAPASAAEYVAMAKWALQQTDHPVVIRIPAIVSDIDIPVSDDYNDLNTFRQISSGSKVAIIAVGLMLTAAMKAAEILRSQGMEPTVINPRFVSGLDAEMLSALEADHQAVVTVEDGILDGGFGQKVASFYSDRPMLVKCLGLPKEFLDRYNPDTLAKECKLTPEGIVDTVNTMWR